MTECTVYLHGDIERINTLFNAMMEEDSDAT